MLAPTLPALLRRQANAAPLQLALKFGAGRNDFAGGSHGLIETD
jgi:hypothetical protein